jgi:hypothetical protein
MRPDGSTIVQFDSMGQQVQHPPVVM